MRYASLGSGSKGNATLVEDDATLVMVDCGFPLAEVERRLARLGCSPSQLDAIFVTHEHGDHIAGVARLSRRYGTPVWMTVGTARGAPGGLTGGARRIHPGAEVDVGALRLRSFPVPHDAREPCQLVIEGRGGERFGMLTDSGSVTPHMISSLSGCDALMLECNYDPQLLRDGPYPPSLKRRIQGDYGHLSNGQAAELLARIDRSRLRQLVVSHISETNNCPQRALDALGRVDGGHQVLVAAQDEGLDWQEIA